MSWAELVRAAEPFKGQWMLLSLKRVINCLRLDYDGRAILVWIDEGCSLEAIGPCLLLEGYWSSGTLTEAYLKEQHADVDYKLTGVILGNSKVDDHPVMRFQSTIVDAEHIAMVAEMSPQRLPETLPQFVTNAPTVLA